MPEMSVVLFRLCKIHFLVGVALGAGLSSICLQYVLQKPVRNLPDDPRERPESLLNPYEVHHLGHRLKSHGVDSEFIYSQSSFKKQRVNLQPVDYFEGYSDVSFPQDESVLKEFGSRRLVHVSILSDETILPDYGTAVRITWASQASIPFQFIYGVKDGDEPDRQQPLPRSIRLPGISAGMSYSFLHLMKSLQYLCDVHIENFDWFTVVLDRTYVHGAALVRLLRTLSPVSRVIIGLPLDGMRDICNLNAGVILSRALMRDLCPRLHECQSYISTRDISLDFSRCLSHLLEMGCSNGSQIWHDLYHNCEGVCSDYRHLLAGSKLDTAFVGPITVTDDFYRIHLHFASLDLQKTQDEVTRLGEQLMNNQNNVNPKFWATRIQPDMFGPSMVQASLPIYEFIEHNGKAYNDGCQHDGSDGDEMALESSSYKLLLQLARDQLGNTVHGMKNFAYRIYKPGVGLEYQFYFLEVAKDNEGEEDKKARRALEKVHQVTVIHQYGSPEFQHKEIQEVRPINFVVAITDDDMQVTDFLKSYEETCLNSNVHQCTLLVLFFKKTYTAHVELKSDVIDLLTSRKFTSSAASFKSIQVIGESVLLPRTLQMAGTTLEPDHILAFLTPDTNIKSEFLYRCQLNTVMGKQLYFPIPFQKAGDNLTEVHPESAGSGVWANSDFSTFCVYNSDLGQLGSYPTEYQGVFENFRTESELKIMRTVDPAVVKPSTLSPSLVYRS